MSAKAVTAASARERLLAAADELFYACGIHTVGIDRVIERAGVAKASLYNTFGSKDALVQAYLEKRHASLRARISLRLEQYADPRGPLLCVFDAQAELFTEPGYHGCAFASASAESPGPGVTIATDDYRRWMRGLLTSLAQDAGAGDPARLARELHMVWDGAQQSFRLDRDPDVATVAKTAAAALLDAALAAPAR